MKLFKFILQGLDINLTKDNSVVFLIFKPSKLISGLLPENVIEEALNSFLFGRLSDLPSVLMPEFLSKMVALTLITSSLFSCQTSLKTAITGQ